MFSKRTLASIAIVAVLGSLGALGASGSGGIAFWAHIGGFAAGLLVMRVFILVRRSRARAA